MAERTGADKISIRDQAYAEVERRAKESEPRARSIRYVPELQALSFELRNGCTVTVPTSYWHALAGATAAQLATIRILDDGEYAMWDGLDADFSIPGAIIRSIAGDDVWRHWSSEWGRRVEEVEARLRSEFARKGGRTKSDARAQASRENGKKGGRPPKQHSA